MAGSAAHTMMIDPEIYREALRTCDPCDVSPRKVAIEYEKKFRKEGEKRCPKNRRIQECREILAKAGTYYPNFRSFRELTSIELTALWLAIQIAPSGPALHAGG